MQSLDNNTRAFLALVRAGLWEKEVRLLTYGEIEWQEIYRLATEQSVLGLVLAGLEHSEVKPPQMLLLQWIGEVQVIEQRNKDMNAFIADLIDKMRKADIYALLVKGQGIAQCYEKPYWRCSGDVDFILSEDNYKKAIRFLTPLASKVEEEIKFSKHIAMTIEGWEVELHGSLHGGLWSSVDCWLDEVQGAIFYRGNVRLWMNGGTQVFLPEANEDVVYVFAHILEHFFY